jgi:hypothetical protein
LIAAGREYLAARRIPVSSAPPAIIDGVGEWTIVFDRALEPGVVMDPSDASVRIDKVTHEITLLVSM